MSTPNTPLYIYLEPLPKTGDIYVTVYDAETYNTISGAYVSGAGSYSYTNYYGNAYFYDVNFGSYYFSASADIIYLSKNQDVWQSLAQKSMIFFIYALLAEQNAVIKYT